MTDRRTRTSIRILVALLVAALVSIGLARSHLVIDDAGVDYTDDDIGEAYIGMDFVDGQLVLTIDDASFEGAMPAIDFDVPDLGREDTLGNDIGAVLADVDDVSWTAVGADVPTSPALHEVVYRHLDLSLDETVDLYADAFESMGFETEIADSAASSVKVGTFTHGDTIVTVRFQALGSEVEVDLSVL